MIGRQKLLMITCVAASNPSVAAPTAFPFCFAKVNRVSPYIQRYSPCADIAFICNQYQAAQLEGENPPIGPRTGLARNHLMNGRVRRRAGVEVLMSEAEVLKKVRGLRCFRLRSRARAPAAGSRARPRRPRGAGSARPAPLAPPSAAPGLQPRCHYGWHQNCPDGWDGDCR
jgi:hypothetical protein